jgi:hypothetical protein
MHLLDGEVAVLVLEETAYFSTAFWLTIPSLAMVISLVYCSGVAWPGMTALLNPSMPIEMAPDRFTLAFSSRTTVALGFLSFALRAAMGPAVPPPITRTSHSTCEQPSTI